MTPDSAPQDFLHHHLTSETTGMPGVYQRQPGPPPTEKLLRTIAKKTGVPAVIWASLYIPVLAVQQGFDRESKIAVGMKSRVVKKTDLAARLGVQATKPIGSQLFQRGTLSLEEAVALDEDIFRGQMIEARLRVWASVDENVADAFAELEALGIVDNILEIEDASVSTNEAEHIHRTEANVTLTTKSFVPLCRALHSLFYSPAVLLSLDGEVVYV